MRTKSERKNYSLKHCFGALEGTFSVIDF